MHSLNIWTHEMYKRTLATFRAEENVRHSEI